MAIKDANISKINQNIYDFVLSNYGNLEYLPNFLKLNDMSMSDYKPDTKYLIDANLNYVVSEYERLNHIVLTDKLRAQSIVKGDYDLEDCNNDFYK